MLTIMRHCGRCKRHLCGLTYEEMYVFGPTHVLAVKSSKWEGIPRTCTSRSMFPTRGSSKSIWTLWDRSTLSKLSILFNQVRKVFSLVGCHANCRSIRGIRCWNLSLGMDFAIWNTKGYNHGPGYPIYHNHLQDIKRISVTIYRVGLNGREDWN